VSLAELGARSYVNLATTRRNGREVRTPVWIAPDGDRLVIYTNAGSGKVKRIRNGGRVRLAPCDVRGRLRGDWVEASARMLDEPEERDRALEAVFRKYGWQMQLARALGTLSGRWSQRAAIEVRVGAPA
jgi:PPOX class probable F420-dependent enzyme